MEEGTLLQSAPVRVKGDWLSCLVSFWWKKKRKQHNLENIKAARCSKSA